MSASFLDGSTAHSRNLDIALPPDRVAGPRARRSRSLDQAAVGIEADGGDLAARPVVDDHDIVAARRAGRRGRPPECGPRRRGASGTSRAGRTSWGSGACGRSARRPPPAGPSRSPRRSGRTGASTGPAGRRPACRTPCTAARPESRATASGSSAAACPAPARWGGRVEVEHLRRASRAGSRAPGSPATTGSSRRSAWPRRGCPRRRRRRRGSCRRCRPVDQARPATSAGGLGVAGPRTPPTPPAGRSAAAARPRTPSTAAGPAARRRTRDRRTSARGRRTPAWPPPTSVWM